MTMISNESVWNYNYVIESNRSANDTVERSNIVTCEWPAITAHVSGWLFSSGYSFLFVFLYQIYNMDVGDRNLTTDTYILLFNHL